MLSLELNLTGRERGRAEAQGEKVALPSRKMQLAGESGAGRG